MDATQISINKPMNKEDVMYVYFPGGSDGKESTCSVGDLGLISGLGRSLEKEMATHSSILAWRIAWTEEPGGLQSMGCKESDMTERLRFHFFKQYHMYNKVMDRLVHENVLTGGLQDPNLVFPQEQWFSICRNFIEHNYS